MEVFFFAGKDRTVHTHTLIFRERKKTGPKKKHTILTNAHDFYKRVVNFKLFPGKLKKSVPFLWYVNLSKVFAWGGHIS